MQEQAKRPRPKARLRTTLIINAVVVSGVLALVEWGLARLLNHPPKGSPAIRAGLRRYYLEYDRKIVQFLPEGGRYDEGLTYTLRPGAFRFSNREFDVELRVNSQGLRDDDASLVEPRIVVVGDSLAMGWGVEQNQAFPQLIEKITGAKVLNAAVSSYGTAREMKLLERLDTSKLETLVIQYSENDYLENKAFRFNANTLPIADQAAFEHTAKLQRAQSDYYIGKHTIRLLPILAWAFLSAASEDELASDPATADTMGKIKDMLSAKDRDEVHAFINVLVNSNDVLSDVRVVAIEINGSAHNDDEFVSVLRSTLATGAYPDFVKNIIAVELPPGLDEDKYFALDDHMTPAGHKVVAEALAATVGFTPAEP